MFAPTIMRIKSFNPKLLLLLAVLLVVLAVWVYLHYKGKLDSIERDMQEMKKNLKTAYIIKQSI